MKNLDKILTGEPTLKLATQPTKHKKSESKLIKHKFMNEIIAGKKDINDEISWNYFKYQNPSI